MRPVFPVLAFALLVACDPPDVPPQTREVDLAFDGASRLEVRLPSGDVEVVAADRAAVGATMRWSGDDVPVLDARLVDGTLVVRLSCPAEAPECAADLSLAVPADTRLDVETGLGFVVVEGIGGDVAVDVGTGTVTLRDLAGTLDVAVEVGSVSGVGLAAPAAHVFVGEGDVELHFDGPVGDLDVQIEHGSVHVTGA